MKNKINFLLISLLICIGLFAYLTIHHFQVQLGTNGPSICAVNSTINCDSAAQSRYSEIFNIPIAILGLVFSLAMFVVALVKKTEWIPFSEPLNGFVKLLFIFAGATSIIMAFISFFKLQVICPFCLATYVFSLINIYLSLKIFNPSTYNLANLFSEKSNLTISVFMLILTWFISAFLQEQYGIGDIKKYAPEKISMWKNSPVYNFQSNLGLVKNPQAQNTIIEFADFKCPHCKEASENLHNFMANNTQVKFIYKAFPLDGTCNPHVPQKGDGSRCKMAAWALCAEQKNNKGWDVHSFYFEKQEELMFTSDLKETNQKLANQLGLNFDEIEKCSDSVETNELIKKMSDEGKAANVQGTPTFYVNSKKMEFGHGQINYLLKTILDEVK